MKLTEIMNKEILTEMPKTIGNIKWNDLFYKDKNHRLYQEVDKDKYKKVYLKINDHVTIYQDGTKFICLDIADKQVTYYMRYKVNHNGKLGHFVWQSLVWRDDTVTYLSGIPKKIFFDVLLPKFGCIVTDSEQTWDGERFWAARIGDAIEVNLHVYYYNFKTKELIEVKTISEFKEIRETHDIWGPSDAHRMKRMVISNKELPIGK